jgi:protein-S-isoprenylcysteine O-methyltransferase Ste14
MDNDLFMSYTPNRNKPSLGLRMRKRKVIPFYGRLLVGIVLLLKYNRGLLEERLNLSQSNQKAWDKMFILLLYLFLFVWTVLMALDAVRFHWSHMPLFLQIIGAIALVVSFVLISLTFRENSFLKHERRLPA